MTPETVLLGLVLGIGLWLLVAAVLPRPKPRMAERIAPHLLDVSPMAREIHYSAHQNPVVIAGIVLSPLVRSIVLRVDSALGGRDSQRSVFERAGRSGDYRDFRIRRTISVITGAIAGVLLGAAMSLGEQGSLWSLLVGSGLAGALVVVGVHDAALRRQASQRSERIAEEFPTLLELLGLSLAAGDSLPRALARVSSRAQGELGQEWASVLKRVDEGAMLGQALRDSAQRLGSPAVVAFVEHLAQALDRGAPLAEVIHAHGADAHADYSRSLVDKAGKAEVQMLVPMVLLILPITVIFAVYPGLQALQFGL